MRMWMIKPDTLCRKHLLGEHVELHMLVGCIDKGYSIQGYIENGLIDTGNIKSRHEQLSQEMKRRGYNHKSDLKKVIYSGPAGHVEIQKSLNDLHNRCTDCLRFNINKERIK